MRFEKISRLGDEEFRRLTGIKHSTFKRMKEILIGKKKTKGGKPNKQCMHALEYLREILQRVSERPQYQEDTLP